MAIITYQQCPSCTSAAISKTMACKDYTVSGESFEIWECGDCTLRFTQKIPDLNEIGNYYKSEAYISHTDTRKGLINTLYHTIRKRTLRGKQSLVSKETGLKSGMLLDIGAGTGAFAHHMKSAGWEVVALEPDEAARKNALAIHQLDMRRAEELWQLDAASFDAITMWHVLEHVHDLKGYMRQLEVLLKPAGKAFIAVPNYTSSDAAHYGEYWAAYDVPRHLYHFSPASMRALVKPFGFHLTGIKPMWYDSFYVSMLSEKYRTGSNNYISAFTTGVRSNLNAMRDPERCSSLIYIIAKSV
jgi:2-polyprenyl-3-methyl-5-hydroxy-6-metoxy-1,4-benzoquinol methylase